LAQKPGAYLGATASPTFTGLSSAATNRLRANRYPKACEMLTATAIGRGKLSGEVRPTPARLVFFRASFIRCGNNPASTGSARPPHQAEHDTLLVIRTKLAARSGANNARLPRCTINLRRNA
jgi:hypothetical protein